MESDKYPKSTFSGKITNIDKVNTNKDGSYPVSVKGTLEIHGVKKEVETKGILKVSGESINATADFSVVLDDYKIPIPNLVKDKLSKTAKIKINCLYTIKK
jgi:polyisoprenoid-binding protein YceI